MEVATDLSPLAKSPLGELGESHWLERPHRDVRGSATDSAALYEHLGGKVNTEREDDRDGTVLVELAYGWPNLKELERLVARE